MVLSDEVEKVKFGSRGFFAGYHQKLGLYFP
jgi:hypothetical protein